MLSVKYTQMCVEILIGRPFQRFKILFYDKWVTGLVMVNVKKVKCFETSTIFESYLKNSLTKVLLYWVYISCVKFVLGNNN